MTTDPPAGLRPPADWAWWDDTAPMTAVLHAAMGGVGPPITCVMTNLDRSIDTAVAQRARAEQLVVQHAAAGFVGWVWWQDGRWHEFVQVHRVDRGSYSAGTLEELMKTVNDEYGWD